MSLLSPCAVGVKICRNASSLLLLHAVIAPSNGSKYLHCDNNVYTFHRHSNNNRVEQLEKQQGENLERFKIRTKELKTSVSKELQEATLDAAGI